MVWQGVGFSNNKEYASEGHKTGVDRTQTIIVSLGRVTGLSRVPDAKLLYAPTIIRRHLADLPARLHRLEDIDCSAVSARSDIYVEAAMYGVTASIF